MLRELPHPMISLLPSRFAPKLEAEFQKGYFALIRPGLRQTAALLAALILIYTAIFARAPAPYDLAVGVPQFVFWLLVFGLTWVRGWERAWQPVLMALGWVMAGLVLGQLAPMLAQEVTRVRGVGLAPPSMAQQKFYFIIQMSVLAVSLATLRFQFLWAAMLYGGLLAIGIWTFVTGLGTGRSPFLDARFAFLPCSFILCVILLGALTLERLARRAFLATHQLEEERNDEKRKREETEGKLHVLAQAIGGIVHDLGNPLNIVQMGAQSLQVFLEDDPVDKAALGEFATNITNGGEMLNYLRVSLMEQTRVLEGKPIPIEASNTSLRGIIESGAQYQVPKFRSGREILIVGDDLEVRVDRMKMTAVLMNLIGNALKYSDGEIRVNWRELQLDGESPDVENGKWLLIAVLDRGMDGTGITQEQSAKLFTAFSRLDTHSKLEGTGLGLLSVKKIVAAHGGEVFIEGYKNGTPGSPPFSTAQKKYPTMLKGECRTAFVVTLPLADATQ